MHPAFSVIIFTVASGMGYGIFVFSALIALTNTSLDTAALTDGLQASTAVGLLCVTIGLVSSTFHLANPKNAWRAFLRFKSSWLSREGVFAILAYPIAFTFFGATLIAEENPNALLVSAIFLVIISLVTIYSTGMIYACLKTIRAWNSPLVPCNYILIGLLSGSLATTTIFSFQGDLTVINLEALTLLPLLVLVTKVVYYYFIGKPSGLSVKTATGLSGRIVRLLHSGESAKNFSMREFGFEVSSSTVIVLRGASLTLMTVLPTTLILTTEPGFEIYLSLTVLCIIGAIVERWLFFAEAKHVVNLYYGREA